MAVPIIQFENKVRVAGIHGVDSFVLFWYDVCSEFIVWTVACNLLSLILWP